MCCMGSRSLEAGCLRWDRPTRLELWKMCVGKDEIQEGAYNFTGQAHVRRALRFSSVQEFWVPATSVSLCSEIYRITATQLGAACKVVVVPFPFWSMATRSVLSPGDSFLVRRLSNPMSLRHF